jgi:hypothetical protein
MTRRRINPNTYYPLGACAVVSAFGTAVLFPAIQAWKEVDILWWLLYVLICAIPIGGGRVEIGTADRLWIALLPPLCQLIDILFQVLVMGHTMGLSDVQSDNPRFWVLAVFIMAITWPFTVLFSFSRKLTETMSAWLARKSSEQQIKNASRATTAAVGLIGAVSLLLKALGLI